MTRKILLILLISSILITAVSAVPITGVPYAIGSNNLTVPLTGVTGTECWVVYGPNDGIGVWGTENYTPSGGAANVVIWGAPLTGGTSYYAMGCDQTGCDATGVLFSTLPITPIPDAHLGNAYRNLSQSHFSIIALSGVIESAYVPGIPRTLLYGVLIGLIFIGIWMRTKSVRMVCSLGIMLGGMLFSNASGLFLGIPLQEQLLGGILLAGGLTGWFMSLVIKK